MMKSRKLFVVIPLAILISFALFELGKKVGYELGKWCTKEVHTKK